MNWHSNAGQLSRARHHVHQWMGAFVFFSCEFTKKRLFSRADDAFQACVWRGAWYREFRLPPHIFFSVRQMEGGRISHWLFAKNHVLAHKYVQKHGKNTG